MMWEGEAPADPSEGEAPADPSEGEAPADPSKGVTYRLSRSFTLPLAALGFLVFVCILLIGCGGSSTDELITQLQDADPKIRLAAARMLSERRGDMTEVVAGLSKAVDHSDFVVREVAITTLGRIGPQAKEAMPALETALLDENSSVRTAAALAIDSIDPNSQAHFPVLIESLRQGDGPVFLAVGRMGARGAWAVPALAALLSDRRPSIRALAAHALGEIGPPAHDVERALKQCMRDPEASVRKAAQSALRQIKSSDDD
jgi:HEAT repeat protein